MKAMTFVRTKASRVLRCCLSLLIIQLALPALVQAALVDVELDDLPVPDVINLLARQAGIQVEMDPALWEPAKRVDHLPWGPPVLRLQLKQVGANQTFDALVRSYGLIAEPVLNQRGLDVRFAKLAELQSKRSPIPLPDPVTGKRKVPLFLFDGAPALEVVKTLALQSGLTLLPSYDIQAGTNDLGKSWSATPITLKVRRVTPQQALEAVMDACGWVVDWNDSGHLGVFYPARRFKGHQGEQKAPPDAETKTDVVLAGFPLEEFIQVMTKQVEINWMASPEVKAQVFGKDKLPLLEKEIDVNMKGTTPMTAMREVLRANGLQFRWNARTNVGVVDVLKAAQ